MNEEAIANIQSIMDEKQKAIEKLKNEWFALSEAQRIYYAADRKHHEFDNERAMQEAMSRNFNPFDTFSLKKKKKK
jgi:hypothetical protein